MGWDVEAVLSRLVGRVWNKVLFTVVALKVGISIPRVPYYSVFNAWDVNQRGLKKCVGKCFGFLSSG